MRTAADAGDKRPIDEQRRPRVSFRAVVVSAAVVLLALGVACERELSAPESNAALPQPRVLRIARARVIEPGDRGILNPPAVDLWSSAGVADPLNMAFDTRTNRVFVLESASNQLIEMTATPGGGLDRSTTKRVDARGFDFRDPQGLTVDPASGRLFVLDARSRIVRLEPHPSLGFHRPIISVIDLAPAGLRHLRGIAFDPTSGHLHVLDPVAQRLYAVSETGRIVASCDVSEFRLSHPRGMTFGPTGDATDDPSNVGLYIGAGEQIIELELSSEQPVSLATAATTTTSTLVRTTETSRYSPPSPDPSGLAYAGHLGSLVIADGEVDEMTIYAGANMFETTLSGSLSRSWTTVPWSHEPVGVAYNPANRHLFIADDDQRKIFEIDPGPDGRYSTADDRMTSFDTRPFGNDDPEGLAYDVAQGVLFIADGVNAQVYRLSPGANGVFDGVSPAGDDQATSFDTKVHGLTDPEGIAYDSDYGHLYVGGKPADVVFQYSTTGTLLGTIDVSVAQADKLAGLEYVPASVNGTRTLYIVDRGVDNDSDSSENDGKMYQFSLSSGSGNALPTVAITAPPDGSVFTHGDAITFTGTASDPEDGDLTARLTWTSSRDGTLGSGSSVTTSTLSGGTHTITASVTDNAGAQASATITVTVNVPGSGAIQVRVAASSDDAEESASGSMALSSSDLELVFDGSNQTVGMRFNGVTIPQGATITNAYVQFQVDEATSEATSLTVRGEATDNAATFSGTAKISPRSKTASAVPWSPAAWTTVGQAGANQQTPNLAAIVQEIVNRPGWRSGNSLAIIITGTGRRAAEAYNGAPAAAPLLHVEYTTGPNTAPTATDVTISGTPQVGQVLTGNYTYSDANGDAEGTSTYRWLRDDAPISGATARTYTLVTADDGRLIRFEVTPVATTGESPGEPVQSAPVGPVTTPPPNSAPVATNVAISGTPQVGQVLTGTYTYGDADGDAEGASTYRWLRDGSAIVGATARTYTLTTADEGTLIVFEVTPVAATGASPGASVQSAAVGPVAAAATFVAVRVAASSDDAEESASGSMSLTSSDLELVFDGSNQTVGIRFNGVAIPQGATITRAYVQFQVDEATSEATVLTITGEAADNAATFSSAAKVSPRPRTASAVAWAPVAWTVVGQAGADQQTPDLAAIVQEIVNRPGWQSGNSLAIIITGTGRRTAEAYNGVPAAAPLLRVDFSVGSPTP
jgi:uncharacterized protein YjiK